MKLHIPLILSALVLIGCKKLDTDIETCNPEKGQFIKGRHYVSSDFITEEGNWEYQTLHAYRERLARFYPNEQCLSYTPPQSLDEKLQETAEKIDFER